MKKSSRTICVILCLTTILALSGCNSSDYKKAVNMMQQGQYTDALPIFSELKDKQYKDSSQLYDECQQGADYDTANAAFQSGDFETAKAGFAALGDYNDSTDRVNECAYAEADAAFQSGSYETARIGFAVLGDYKDSANRVLECIYAEADADFTAKKYSNSQTKFAFLGNYKDSAERAALCEKYVSYNEAIDLESAGSYASACDKFASLLGFEDANAQLNACVAAWVDNVQAQITSDETWVFSAEESSSDWDRILTSFSTNDPQKSVDQIEKIISNKPTAIDEATQQKIKMLSASVYSWATYLQTIFPNQISTYIRPNYASGLLSIFSENNTKQSLDALSAFFLGLKDNKKADESIQTFKKQLGDGFDIVTGSESAANWLNVLQPKNSESWQPDAQLALTTIYQTLFPGSGTGVAELDSMYNILFPKAELDAVGSSANGKLLVCSEDIGYEYVSMESSFMYTYDPRLVPESMNEVEYVVAAVSSVEYLDWHYTGPNGETIKAARNITNVQLLRYPGGKLVKDFGTIEGGDPPDSIWTSATNYYAGTYPSQTDVDALVAKAIQYVLNNFE